MNLKRSLVYVNFLVKLYKAGDWELFYHDEMIGSCSESQGPQRGSLTLRYEISRVVGDYDTAQKAIDENAFKLLYNGKFPKEFEAVYLDGQATSNE
jgi:hypothetical protein